MAIIDPGLSDFQVNVEVGPLRNLLISVLGWTIQIHSLPEADIFATLVDCLHFLRRFLMLL